MRGAVHPLSKGLFALAVGTCLCDPPRAAESPSRLLEGLAAIEEGCRPTCGSGVAPRGIGGLVDHLAQNLLEVPGVRGGGERSVHALNQFIFNTLRIQASHDLRIPDNLLPSSVLARKQGHCVGIAAVYLLLAERLELPIHAVATPSHVFLRYDDGETRLNIETFQQGAHVPDEQYLREHNISQVSIRKGVFLRNLTIDGFLAQVHNNLGVIYSERKLHLEAAREYERAIALHPSFPAAFYNYGTDLLRRREERRAVRMFSKALRFHPTDVWALNNRGLAHSKLEKPEKARRDLEAALRIDPGFEQARRNLATLDSHE